MQYCLKPFPKQNRTVLIRIKVLIDYRAEDGVEEVFTEMHCVRIVNLKRFYRNLIKVRSASL